MGERSINPMLSRTDKFKEMNIINPYRFQTGVPIPRNGLIAEYLFSGNANDTSGNGNNGTVNGAVLTTDRKGNSNSAYQFDGNDYIVIGNALDFAGTNTFSVAIDIYYTGSNGQLIGRDNVTFRQWATYVSDGRFTLIGFDANGTTSYARQSSVLVSNTWYRFVAIFDNGIPHIYKNNSLDNVVTVGSLINSFRTANINNDIGRRINSTFFYTGKIDQIRVYNRVLTTDEITALYNE